MNWTGGNLQRTKNANKGVLQKQKAFFVRARTQLQHSSGTPATPFRPDYLHDSEDPASDHHLPSLGSDSIRHTGHSARKRRELRETDASATARRHGDRDWRQSHQLRTHVTQHKRPSDVGKGKTRDGRRNVIADNIEAQLLEANKKRLLRQQDWIGVAPSKPVDMHFSSIKEKSRIGKRRKIEDMNKTVAHCRSPTTFTHIIGQKALDGHGNAFMSGALPIPTAVDNIRVRIGSDALTTAASTQLHEYAQSQTNSDSMLFDEEGENAARRTELEAPRSDTPSGRVPVTNPRTIDDQPVVFAQEYSPQHGQSAHHDHPANFYVHAQGSIQHSPTRLITLGNDVGHSEATDPSYRITHHVRGVERPLKLVFGRRTSSKPSHPSSPFDEVGEAHRTHVDFDADEFETGYASRYYNGDYQSVVRRPPNPPVIVDDEPWRNFLDIRASSFGKIGESDGTGTSVPQPHVPARSTAGGRTSWPQHATQGNLTHVNLSNIPASLSVPSRPSGRRPDTRPNLRTSAVKDIDDNEKVWRSFVLGSDAQSAIDTIHTHSETSKGSTSWATKGYASTRVPLSTAVTSVSSTPCKSTLFRSLSGQVSRITDDVQYAPHSGSRSTSSPASSRSMWSGIESLSEDKGQGDETPTRGRGCERSTHAWMQAHASHDTEMVRTSRGDLDPHDRAWDDDSRRAQANGSVVRQRGRGSSISDIPDSDDVGISLVDPDRLT